MKFEHVALNVPNALAMAAWYATHCDLRIIRSSNSASFTHFMADDTGRTMLELYSNTADAIPDYALQQPVRLHIAFAVDDAAQARDRLLAAGATLVSDNELPDGTRLVMLRDPWNVPLQLCQRSVPLP